MFFKLSLDNLKNKIFSEVKHDDNDFDLLDFIKFESELIYNKILNNINCGFFLSTGKPICFPEKYKIKGKLTEFVENGNICYLLTRLDDTRILYIYFKNNPEKSKIYNFLEYCLEEYCKN